MCNAANVDDDEAVGIGEGVAAGGVGVPGDDGVGLAVAFAVGDGVPIGVDVGFDEGVGVEPGAGVADGEVVGLPPLGVLPPPLHDAQSTAHASRTILHVLSFVFNRHPSTCGDGAPRLCWW